MPPAKGNVHGFACIAFSNFSYIKIAEAALLSHYARVRIAAIDAVLRCDLFRARYRSYWTTSRTALALLAHARQAWDNAGSTPTSFLQLDGYLPVFP